MTPETLTKENFWDELQQLYPEGMKVFSEWIDEYKKRVGWAHLFNSKFRETEIGRIYQRPKYHDLPTAMQAGIFLEFVEDKFGYPYLGLILCQAGEYITRVISFCHDNAKEFKSEIEHPKSEIKQ